MFPRRSSPRRSCPRSLHDPSFDVHACGARVCASPLFTSLRSSRSPCPLLALRRFASMFIRVGSRARERLSAFTSRSPWSCSPFDAHVHSRRSGVHVRARLSTLTSVFAAGCPRPFASLDAHGVLAFSVPAIAFVSRRSRVASTFRFRPSLVHSPRSRSCSPHDDHDRVHFV